MGDGSRSPATPPDDDQSFAARLRAKHGAGVDPEVSLDAAVRDSRERSPTGPPSELIRRLAEHSLKGSQYALEGEIARGGMGAILRVWDGDLRRHLAMKVILRRDESPSSGAMPSFEAKQLARFLEEAQVTGQLDHPGIVPVHELGLDDEGRVYFTMKLVKGRDLKHVFDLVFEGREGWSETRALSVILRACEAVAYAHKKGVIHRDLKPANVMVGNFGEVYVMDWGLARVLGQEDRHDIRIATDFEATLGSVRTERQDAREHGADASVVTMDGDVMGTPAYMAPEQARGEIEKLGPRSDVYSMGAMLYHLLAGRAPYTLRGARIDNRAVLALVSMGAPTPLAELRRDVPPELAAICEKAMARDASHRYADTLALAEDLRAHLEHRVVAAYEAGAWAEARKWIERNTLLAAALAGVVLFLVAGLTASWIFKERADESALLASRRADETAEQARIAQANEAEAREQEQLASRRADELAVATRLAEENGRLATEKANDVLSLSAIQELHDLEERADALWPAHPEHIAAYERWLADARVLIEGRAADPARGVERHASLADHERRLADLRRRARANAGEPGEYVFDDPEDRWWHAQLAALVSRLKSFQDEREGGLFSAGVSAEHGWGIVKRSESARSIDERSVSGPDARRRWDEAIEAIAESPRYRNVIWPSGARLVPQMGLLPIGEDPVSGLWEFAHLQSGTAPERGAHGRLEVTESMAIVLVLIPGGTFRMGAQSTDASAPNYDPHAAPDESPVHDVVLSPYFLSKYEMTQGQWLRFVGSNPSTYGPSASFAGRQHDLRHPVEQVSWVRGKQVLARLGLVLPSEAQWECACRGGNDSPWWTGIDKESLRHHVNVADQAASRSGVTWGDIQDWPSLDDGWAMHAAVGSFPANPHGLHEVHGNVWEWCADGYDAEFYARSPRTDPVAPALDERHRVGRGGGFANAASHARSSHRGDDAPQGQSFNLGLRPARTVSAH